MPYRLAKIIVFITFTTIALVGCVHASERVEAPNAAAILEQTKISPSKKLLDEGFEETTSNKFVKQFSRRSPCKIIYSGVTNELARSGEQSYKIQLRMEAGDIGGTIYFLLPFEIPAWSNLKLSMYVKVKVKVEPDYKIYSYHGFSVGDAEAGTSSGTNKGDKKDSKDGWEHWVSTVSGEIGRAHV